MEQLGIEPGLLIAQLINFSLIVFVLTKLLYKPILNMLEKRRKEIEDGLALTQKMRGEEEKLQQKKARVIEEAKKEARQIIENAKKEAKNVEKEIVNQAQEDAREIIAKGKEEVKRLQESMTRDMRVKAVDLAVAMAKRLISNVLTTDDKRKMLERHLKELERIEA